MSRIDASMKSLDARLAVLREQLEGSMHPRSSGRRCPTQQRHGKTRPEWATWPAAAIVDRFDWEK
jgi:hypothetical protein